MKKKAVPLLAFILLMLLVTGYCIYNYVTFVHTPPALTDKEKSMVDDLFAATKVQCAGRFLFEVPAVFENIPTENIRINDIRISSQRLYPPAFAQRIRLREQELQNKNTVREMDRPFLKQVYRINDHMVIFDRNRNTSVAGFSRILEGHLYADGIAFILVQDITDLSDPVYKKDRQDIIDADVSTDFMDNKQQKLSELKDLMSRISGREDEEIPSDLGSCIPQGFIRDSNETAKENITFIYSHYPAFSLSVSTNTYQGDSRSMLERSNEIQPYLSLMKARTLRKEKTQIAGFEADEWLNIAPPRENRTNNSPQLLFNVIANEKTVDFRHPLIDLTLSNSIIPQESSTQSPLTYSDAELTEIWDRITRSFRLRNNAFGSGS